jgi:hypothetical protein
MTNGHDAPLSGEHIHREGPCLGTGVGSGRCETHLVYALRQSVSAEVSGEW